jgi:phenylacetate-coenzyme A ligase PaaK-like adenylate-forming protein
MSTYAELKARHCQDLFARLPEMIAHIGWSQEQLRVERERRLRELIDTAVQRSTWHRARLSGLGPATITEDTLAGVPPMTKDDLLEHFDEIVTDPRLRRDLVEAHLLDLREDAYLLDRYHAFASGGSSGRRGVFVYGWDAWASCAAGILRWRVSWQRSLGLDQLVMASVSAGHATHMTAAMMATFSSPRLALHRFPVTLPLSEIVEGINALQPDVLHGYPTVMRLLALETRAGRLRISPRRIAVGSEPLLPETRQLLAATWGVTVENVYATSEAGGVAGTCAEGLGLHLNDDLVILEPVDTHGRPTPVGELSAKVYLTCLYNLDLPLIRYELDDQVRVLARPCGCGSAMTAIEDVHGRSNDSFHYGNGVVAHPLIFSTVLGRATQVAEYQVHQRERGADVLVQQADQPPDLVALRRDLETGLITLGLPHPVVTLRIVDTIPRQTTGKTRRFIPLTS